MVKRSDWSYRLWEVSQSTQPGLPRWREYSRPCSDPMCLVQVVVRCDALGMWFAEHKTWTGRYNDSESSSTSPRFEMWEQAADWAVKSGIID